MTTDTVWSFDQSHASSLIWTGFVLGSFHVLTPDHLSALSALSVGGSWRSFSLGVRWSVGHSLGLLLCTAIFLLMKGDLDLHRMERYCDALVGLFMIMIGGYGVTGSIKNYQYKTLKKTSPQSQYMNENSNSNSKNNLLTDDEEKNLSHAHKKLVQDKDVNDLLIGNFYYKNDDDLTGTGNTKKLEQFPDNDNEAFVDMRNPTHQRFLSIGMGLLHGVAGPGGVIGVIPAVEMRHWQSSILYLGSFIIASTLSMGLFAAFYGEFTKRLGATAVRMEFLLRLFSSSASVLVGAVWLWFTFSGQVSFGKFLEGSVHNLKSN